MLCDEERDTSFAKTFRILAHHIITHDLYITAIGLKQIISHDMRLRCQCYTMMCSRMFIKVLTQHLLVLVAGSVERQIENMDDYLWKMVVHIMTESHLTVILLLADYLTVLGLSHQHNLLFLSSKHHQHLGCKIARAERILSIEGERAQVWHIRIEKDKWNTLLMQLVCKATCHFQR